ncbi:MAG: class I SAM-dependent methyltransferase [Bacteroidales bacterium]|nr:class I SAM-dependent methyltransferase [Candidatus Latescibacterota bacterium]
MKKDHSHIYKDKSLKNWPHRQRLKEIKSVIEKEGSRSHGTLTYADVGCGTGFLTKVVANQLKPEEVYGFDHSEHLEVARKKNPSFKFEFMELNNPADVGQHDFVTCFETIEHVGNPDSALSNLIKMTKSGGTLLLTAPIEIGPVGLVKFLAKTIVYNYKLDELSGNGANLYNKYLLALISYKDISKFRDQRFGWGTHFGFDYRRVDDLLRSKKIKYRTKNVVTTRFYIVKP